MSSRFSYECRCAKCGTEGHVFWSEGGGRDQHEWITQIWGEFQELPLDKNYIGPRQRGKIVCRRCGAPAIVEGSETAYRTTPEEERKLWCRG
jgi:hypothetical protein